MYGTTEQQNTALRCILFSATDLDITHCQYIFNHIWTLIIIPINSVNKIINSAGVNAAEGRLYMQYFCFNVKSVRFKTDLGKH